MREKIMLVCSQCLSRNYKTTKQKYESKERMEIKKYCKHCNAYTVHKESK